MFFIADLFQKKHMNMGLYILKGRRIFDKSKCKDLPKGQDIPTVEVLKAGFFVSATYNISNLIRKKLETDYTLNL